MNHQEHEIADYDSGPLRKQYTLFLGVWSQFCYVGAQVAVAGYFISTFFDHLLEHANDCLDFCVEAGRSKAAASDLLAVAQGVYAGNRFLAGFLLMVPAIKPRYLLTVYLGMCFVFSVAAMNTAGTQSIVLLIFVFVFESACFATIFTMSLRGLGRHTKRGGSFLVAAISGGCVFPPMMGAVVTDRNAHIALAIPMMGYILAWVFPIYVNIFQRKRMDEHRLTTVGLVEPTDKELELERNASHVEATTEIVEDKN